MGFLSKNSQEKLKSIEGEKIRKVSYYYWENDNSEEGFRSLDWIEIKLHNDDSFVLNFGEESDGIELVEFSFEDEKEKIKTQFQGQIKLGYDNATLDEHWFPILDTAIAEVKFETKRGNVLNDRIILKFTDKHMVEIYTLDEGMKVDYYEEI